MAFLSRVLHILSIFTVTGGAVATDRKFDSAPSSPDGHGGEGSGHRGRSTPARSCGPALFGSWSIRLASFAGLPGPGDPLRGCPAHRITGSGSGSRTKGAILGP